ncbi:MAG: hypothetical protein IIC26_08325, partial [Chloroflexi bacterium]|nr:hypothetical protein [Chloroflexota bacterium]
MRRLPPSQLAVLTATLLASLLAVLTVALIAGLLAGGEPARAAFPGEN